MVDGPKLENLFRRWVGKQSPVQIDSQILYSNNYAHVRITFLFNSGIK